MGPAAATPGGVDLSPPKRRWQKDGPRCPVGAKDLPKGTAHTMEGFVSDLFEGTPQNERQVFFRIPPKKPNPKRIASLPVTWRL